MGAAEIAADPVAAVEAAQGASGGTAGRGLSQERAWTSAMNGHGPWWNAGASHMNQALPTSYFARLGLFSLVQEHRRLQLS